MLPADFVTSTELTEQESNSWRLIYGNRVVPPPATWLNICFNVAVITRNHGDVVVVPVHSMDGKADGMHLYNVEKESAGGVQVPNPSELVLGTVKTFLAPNQLGQFTSELAE